MWASMSVDGCCRCKVCLYKNVHILLYVPPSENGPPAKVNDSMVRNSIISVNENMPGIPQQNRNAVTSRKTFKAVRKNS